MRQRRLTAEDVWDAPNRGNKAVVPPAETKTVARWKMRTEDPNVFASLRVMIYLREGGPIEVNIVSSLDGDEIPHTFCLREGQAQGIETSAAVLSIGVTNRSPLVIANPNQGEAKLSWRIDDRCTPPTTLETTEVYTGDGLAQELTAPVFTQHFCPWWKDGENAPKITWYDQDGIVVAERTPSVNGGEWMPLGRQGRITVTAQANQRYQIVFRCYG